MANGVNFDGQRLELRRSTAGAPTVNGASCERQRREFDCQRLERRGSMARALTDNGTSFDVAPGVDVDIDEEKQEYDGAALRRSRLRRGVELDQISDVTKVSVTYLQFLEDEAFEQLPASVYVRGFVSAYARAIGLDARRVANSYMARHDASKKPRRRSQRMSSY